MVIKLFQLNHMSYPSGKGNLFSFNVMMDLKVKYSASLMQLYRM